MTKDEVIKRVLGLLKQSTEYRSGCAAYIDAVEDVDALLAQPEQEPVEFLVEAECKKCGAKETGIAKLKATQAPAVPQGWKLVPVEPTDAMWNAMMDYGTKKSEWRAILAAAPQAPAVQPLTDEQIQRLACKQWGYISKDHSRMFKFARSIEAAHGITPEAGA